MTTHRAWLLLLGVILVWGIHWSVIKIGLDVIPPMTYAMLRVVVGAIVLALLMARRGRLALPDRRDLPVVLSYGLLAIAGASALMIIALVSAPAGRSSILTYTLPLWVVPIMAWVTATLPTRRELVGLVLGLGGLVLLLNPLAMDWSSDRCPGRGRDAAPGCGDERGRPGACPGASLAWHPVRCPAVAAARGPRAADRAGVHPGAAHLGLVGPPDGRHPAVQRCPGHGVRLLGEPVRDPRRRPGRGQCHLSRGAGRGRPGWCAHPGRGGAAQRHPGHDRHRRRYQPRGARPPEPHGRAVGASRDASRLAHDQAVGTGARRRSSAVRVAWRIAGLSSGVPGRWPVGTADRRSCRCSDQPDQALDASTPDAPIPAG